VATVAHAVAPSGRALTARVPFWDVVTSRPLIGEDLQLDSWSNRPRGNDRLNSEGREERLTDFFDAAVLGLCILGADGRIVDANRAELELFGYARDEYVGRAWSDFHVDPDRAKSLLERLAKGEALEREPVRLRCKNGEERDVVIDSNARFDAGAFVAARCITRRADEGRCGEHLQAERGRLAAADAAQRRVGRDLHDGLGQVLVGAALSARRLVDRAPDELRVPLAKLVDILNDATTRVQNIARGLAPIRLGELTLSEALSNVCAAARASGGVECTIDVHPSSESRTETESAQICLIVQEATRNAIRHGRATQIRVGLHPDGELLALSVRDNGSGIAADAKSGLGIESMRCRAEMFGGTFTLENGADGGALVRCAWPSEGARPA